MDERVRFIGDVGRGDWTFSSLCEHYAISRKTGYSGWIATRLKAHLAGRSALVDR